MIINRDTKNAFVLGDFESVAATLLPRADTSFFGLDEVYYASKKRKLVYASLEELLEYERATRV